MAFATIDDFTARTPHALTAKDEELVETYLEDASNALELEYLRHGAEVPTSGARLRALTRISVYLVQRVMSTRKQHDEWEPVSGDDPFLRESWYDANGELRLSAEERRMLGLPRVRTRAAFVSAWARE